jgi:hypothetical protein
MPIFVLSYTFRRLTNGSLEGIPLELKFGEGGSQDQITAKIFQESRATIPDRPNQKTRDILLCQKTVKTFAHGNQKFPKNYVLLESIPECRLLLSTLEEFHREKLVVHDTPAPSFITLNVPTISANYVYRLVLRTNFGIGNS